jgi:hypothetical protein
MGSKMSKMSFGIGTAATGTRESAAEDSLGTGCAINKYLVEKSIINK